MKSQSKHKRSSSSASAVMTSQPLPLPLDYVPRTTRMHFVAIFVSRTSDSSQKKKNTEYNGLPQSILVFVVKWRHRRKCPTKITCRHQFFQLPTFGEAQKSLNCLCNGTASPLKASVSTDRTGYSPGERIILTMQLKNLPLTQNYQSAVFLVQTIAYKGRCGKTRTERFQHKLFKRSSLSWEVDELGVPDVPPTMKNCGIICISYHLKVYRAMWKWRRTKDENKPNA